MKKGKNSAVIGSEVYFSGRHQADLKMHSILTL
jgi:hypothetical protein